MQVTVAKTAGFCFGVRRALELTQKSAALSPTCTLGELIHNRQVVEELAGQGVTVIERPEDAPAGTAVVTLKAETEDDVLKKAVEERDYKVISIC